MTGAAVLAAGFAGAVIGSFLNVCIYRLPRGLSVVWPPSRCPACDRRLAWFENIPMLGYLALRGRCRSCRARITPRYPLVEATTAVLFAASWWYYEPGLLMASRLTLGCALIVLFAVDLEHHLLPNSITLPGTPVGLVLSSLTEPGWLSSLIGIAVGGGILYVIAEAYYLIRHEEGLGLGDVKMLAMIGAFTGWKLTLVTLVMASLAGSVVGLLLMATGKGDLKHALPFGSFLAVGCGLAVTVGPALIEWYTRFW